jgi:hypothetical protein
MLLILASLTLLGEQLPTIVVSDAALLMSALSKAGPGSVIKIAPGSYRGVFASNLHGTSDRPIVITAQDSTRPPKFTSGLQFSKVSHIQISDLVIENATTNGLNIDDGGTIGAASHHVRVSKVQVRHLPKGNHDGIKLSGLDDFEVADCTIEDWGGSGIDMVGCHRGKISGCTFRQGGDSGVQAKGGTSTVLIEKSRFESYGQRGVNIGGSTGLQFFRPALESIPSGSRYEAKDIRVRGCTFIGGATPFAFVGVDGAEVAFNTIYLPERWALRILQETTVVGFVPSRRGVFADNLIVFRSENWVSGGVNIGPGTSAETFSFARNFWFNATSASASKPKLPVPELGGVYGVDPGLIDAGSGDLRVKPGSPAAGVGAHALRR